MRATFLILLALLGAAPATAQAADFRYFKTPSANIVCYISSAGVVCGIQSGLKPAPKRRDCHGGGDFVSNRLELGKTGRAHPQTCAGDTGPFAGLTEGARTLRYGKTIKAGRLRCTSRKNGLTCRNLGHGFFLSRDHWRAL